VAAVPCADQENTGQRGHGDQRRDCPHGAGVESSGHRPIPAQPSVGKPGRPPPGYVQIRESGAIEQNARCILGLYREEYALQSRIGVDGSVVRNTNESNAAYQKRATEFDANLKRSCGKGSIVDMWFDGPTTWSQDQRENERGQSW